MAQKKGPTEQHLKAALQFVAESELTVAKITPLVTKPFDEQIAALPEPWRSLVKAEAQANAAALTPKLRAKAPDVATEAIKDVMNGYVYPTLQMTDAEVVDLVSQNVTVAGFLKTDLGKHYAGLFTNFVKVTADWKWCGARVQDAQKEVEALVAKAKELNTAADLVLTTMLNAGKSAPGTIADTRQQLVLVGKDALFGQCVGPLLSELNSSIDEIEVRLKGCTPAAFTTCLLKLQGRTLSKITADDIRLVCGPVTQLSTLCELDAKSIQAWMSDGTLNALRPAFTKNHHPAGFLKLLTVYGFQGWVAVCSLKSPDKKAKVITLWPDIQQEFVNQVPARSSSPLIVRFMELACTGTDVKDSCIKIIQGPKNAITVAKEVTPFGWQLIGDVRFPRAFSKGTVSTDDACIKHVAEEVGPGATAAKLQKYFEEMVVACVEAGKLFTQGGQVPMSAYTIECAVGVWNIMIGTSGQKKIFHIDSGYEKSNWVKA
ncbi:hypothetical protein J4573_20150 [Actinomadura barringtoniae]|uniref:Uncharacterized protein n=1 Tax=Actinomadura barringtoniae TaxID=1427535 RepID=A0A939TAT7_9ACTN|nr:hypothetical protein [Actinomadura barringtoniae]MBO2449425.1 hypothetical protein [Actinomadura barringtoniae]